MDSGILKFKTIFYLLIFNASSRLNESFFTHSPLFLIISSKKVIIVHKYLFCLLGFFLVFFTNIVNSANALPDLGTAGSEALSIEKEKEYGWGFRLMANQGLPIIHDPVINNYIKVITIIIFYL